VTDRIQPTLDEGASHAGASRAEEIVVVADASAAARVAAERIAAGLARAVAARGRADWATTGGSTAPAIYRQLADEPIRSSVPWPDVHVWWGDDRFVPRDHPFSNVKPFDDILVCEDHGVPLPVDHLHPFRAAESIGAGWDAAWTANALANELAAAGLPERGGWPAFDVLVLGIGGDGHVLSVFPGSAAFEATELAVTIPAPTHIEPHVERVTLNPALVEAATEVIVVATGESKAAVLAEVFGDVRDPHRWPAQLARRPGATWILDEAAAAAIPR
jgi:6-phosphogluconolactonase